MSQYTPELILIGKMATRRITAPCKHNVIYICQVQVKHLQLINTGQGSEKSRPILIKLQTWKTMSDLNSFHEFHFHLWAIKIQYLDRFMIFYVNSRPSCANSRPFLDLISWKRNPDHFKVWKLWNWTTEEKNEEGEERRTGKKKLYSGREKGKKWGRGRKIRHGK